MDIRDPFGNSISCTLFPKELASFQKRIRDLGGKSFAIEPGVAIHFGASINYYEGKLGLVITKLKKLAPPPALPAKKDLEAKSIKMKISGPKKPRKTKNAPPVIELMEEVDDELTEVGLDEEIDENDVFTEDDYLSQIADKDDEENWQILVILGNEIENINFEEGKLNWSAKRAELQYPMNGRALY